MPGPYAYFIWLLCTSAEAFVVVCALYRGCFRRYLALNIYMAACVVASIGCFRILLTHGFNSHEYAYFYYYSDLFVTIVRYFALTSLYAHIFDEMAVERGIRFGAIVLLLGTAACSFAIVMQSGPRITGRFFGEVSQNLNFVGLILTYVLWGAVLKLRETRTRLIQLILSLGVFFSLLAATFALRILSPPLHSLLIQSIMPVMECLLPISWAYAFWRFPDDARLVPARLATVLR